MSDKKKASLDVFGPYKESARVYVEPSDMRMAHVLLMNAKADVPRLETRVFIIGAPDDRGVVNNRGRAGAAGGPAAFRAYFGKCVAFDGADLVCDLGDVPVRENIQESHDELAQRVKSVMTRFPHALVVVIGGGHDYAYGEMEGVLLSDVQKTLGIVNIDAHLDVRPRAEGGVVTSGDPFRSLWIGYEGQIGFHTVIGAQKSATAKAHLDFLEKFRTKVIFADDLLDEVSPRDRLYQEMDLVFSATDRVCVNVDMDVFSMAHAPGVSAPSPWGLSPTHVLPVLARFAKNPFMRTLGVYELNPAVDFQDQTARLAARMVYGVCEARARSPYVKPVGG